MSSFKDGQTVFTADGRKGFYVGRRGTQHVLSIPVYDGEDQEVDQILIEVSAVYVAPPTTRRLAEIADLDRRILERREALRKIDEEYGKACEKGPEILRLVSRAKGLERLTDLIEGRITHCVVGRRLLGASDTVDHIQVQTLAEACRDRESGQRTPGVALLSLFGDSDGHLTWRVNDYKDGSGTWRTVIPCASEIDAVAKAADIIMTGITAAHERKDFDRIKDLIASADKLGVEIAPDARQWFTAYQQDLTQKKIGKLQAEIDALRACA